MSPQASLILGLAAYYGFRRLPLAGLDRAQQLLDAKQSELLSQKSQLEMQNLRFDAALNNMSQGLCMCDGEHKLVVCNAPYVRMYGLPPELVQPGTPFADIIQPSPCDGPACRAVAGRVHARPARRSSPNAGR